MFPAATLFLDVCVQRELWIGGSWPLVGAEAAQNVLRLLEIAGPSAVRRGRVLCRHGPDGYVAAAGAPVHGLDQEAGVLPDGAPPIAVGGEVVESGCGMAPDQGAHAGSFLRMTSGIRDAVVFGAGIEHGIAHVAAALLRRRIRTHLAIDASGTADEVAAQVVVGALKRRGADVATVDVIARLLRRP
ncbi:MAG: hypothetical protein IT294_07255 [Deltaproteobacteria bacterium]|nr:hypothetical protein [Deltaproteobacteria bacterium]